jgi:hypothetical protein
LQTRFRAAKTGRSSKPNQAGWSKVASAHKRKDGFWESSSEFSKPTQEITGRNLHHPGDSQQRFNGNDLLSAFDFANILPVQIHFFGQFLLCEVCLLSKATNRITDNLPVPQDIYPCVPPWTGAKRLKSISALYFGVKTKKYMRDIFGNRWCPLFVQHFATVCLAAGLLLCPKSAQARPRGPFPPIPESGVIFHENFDWLPYSSTNAFVPVSGVGFLVESWAGYALERAGATVQPWTLPALDATGHTNLTCGGAGAVRFFFSPHFSSASVQGGTGTGASVHLADLDASSASGSILDWSLQVSADGASLQLLDYSGSSPVQILSAPIAWQARQNHLVALDYGPQGTALFIDGQLVAQGGGTAPIPTSVGTLVLGSSMSGADTARGRFDELFSFDHQLSAAEVAMYFQFTGAVAAMGPISADEDADMAAAAQFQMALPQVYDLNHNTTLSPGGPVYLTNISATLQTNGTTTVSFSIGGGTNGLFYDVFCATNLNNTLDNSQWSWVGQGLTCNTYSFASQPGNQGFYILELPQQTTVWGWGRDTAGQCDVPLGLITAQAIAAGGEFSLAACRT